MGDWLAELIAKYQVKRALDVGANVGGWIEPWLGHGVAEIHAIEPVPSCMAEMRAKYGTDPRVHLHQVGVSDVPVKLSHVNVHNAWSLVSEGDATAKTLGRALDFVDVPSFDVELVTIDDFLDCYDFAPDLIKIDVDGYDAKALRGAERYLRKRHPPVIFEMSFLPKFYGDDCEAMVGHVFDLGYVITRAFASWIDPARHFRTAAEFMVVFPWDTSFDVILEAA